MKNVLLLLSALCISLVACKPKAPEKADTEKNAGTTIQANAPVDQVVGVASIEPLERLLPLYSESSGVVTQIRIEENQMAKAGDIIAELSHSTEDAQLAQVKSKFNAIQQQIAVSKSTKESVEVRYRQAIQNFNRNQNLYNAQALTQQVLDDSRAAMDALQKDVQSAEAAIKQQEARLAELNADLTYFESLLAKKFIKAPKNGKVLNLEIRLGSNVSVSLKHRKKQIQKKMPALPFKQMRP